MTTLIRSAAALSCAIAAASFPSVSIGGVNYALAGSFTLADGLSSVDALSDGRLIGVRADGALLAQTSVHSSSWSQVGAIDASLLNAFGPSFLSVNPGGSRLAIGDGNFGPGASVLLVDIGALNPMSVSNATSVASANFAARWSSDDTLYVTGAADFSGSIVTELNASTLSTRVVVNDIQGGSGGVVTDGTWLYTGNGFDFDPTPGTSETGEVRAFRLSEFDGSPLSFEQGGLPVADALSAGSLAIDALGNLIIGGADFAVGGESGFFSVINSNIIADALLGAGIVPDSLETMLDPSNGSAFAYSVLFNSATNETVAISGGVAYRFTIPAPGAGALGLLALGALSTRRRAR
jgi:uncharacterized protein (TIGR03382 family)